MNLTKERRSILKASGVLFAAIIAAYLVFEVLMRFIGPDQNLPLLVTSVVIPILMFLILLGPGVVVLLLVFHWHQKPNAKRVVPQVLVGIIGSTILSAAAFSLLFHRDGPNDYGIFEFLLMQLREWGWWVFWAGVTLVVFVIVLLTERNLKRSVDKPH
ncbi:MAG: hypothetical protein HY340_02455 [Candidatus Kerfeldbacteria bacterium]|nr:hypothetical protein [Candidatus Kerfeldbacteria bacterium]